MKQIKNKQTINTDGIFDIHFFCKAGLGLYIRVCTSHIVFFLQNIGINTINLRVKAEVDNCKTNVTFAKHKTGELILVFLY